DGEIGVRTVEGNKCIWAAALEEQQSKPADRAATSPVLEIQPASTTAAERRRHPRYHCRGEVEVRTAAAGSAFRVSLTDISLSGCYAETLSPLPVNTLVDLVLKVAGVQISIQGVVRTSHPSMGMGIGFVSDDPEQWKELAHMVNQVIGATSPAKAATNPGT